MNAAQRSKPGLAKPKDNDLIRTVILVGIAFAISSSTGAFAHTLVWDDCLNACPEADTWLGHDHIDLMTSRGGWDDVAGQADTDSIGLGDGVDVSLAGGNSDSLEGGTSGDDADGESGDDIVDGEDGFDTVRGGPGDDTVKGGPGNDDVRGGDGNNDECFGGAGDDTFSGCDGNVHDD